MNISKEIAVIVILACILSALGCSHEVDHISAYVMQTTQTLNWVDAFTLYHLPQPMDDYGFRPISVGRCFYSIPFAATHG